VLVSKSGSTPEPNNAYALVARALSEQGLDVASRSIAISCEGSALWKRAEKERWRRLFPMWDWVGGRVSVCCAVGLLPGDLAGVDTAAFLAGARDMDEWTRTTSWRENPAALMAGGWYLVGSGHGDRAMVVLPYSDRLALLSRHLQQLVMESLGKKHDRQGNVVHQGLVVYGNKGSTDQHAYEQQLRDGRDDFFAVFVQVLGDGNGDRTELGDGANAGDYLQGFLLGTRRALREGGRPSLTITIPAVDAYALGGIFALFERAVSLYGSLVDVNAYDQPGVEAGKKAACEVLLLCARLREALGPTETELPALAAKVNADVVEVFYVLERWCATGRAVRVAQPGTPRYRASRGSDA
jgi:glucose-6-phosphate isomerase